MKTIKYKILLLTILFSLGTLLTFADDPGPDPGGDPDAPIDGGVSLLVAAGIAIGAKKLYDKRKSEMIKE